MTSWHGHRDDDDIPEPVREVWNAKFRPGAGPGTNVDACVLDSRGSIVRWFGAIPPGRDGRKGEFLGSAVASHWKAELRAAREELGLGDGGKARAVALPGLSGEARAGIRVFTRLDDPGMPAYNAPVVEVVPVEDWSALARPTETRSVDAEALLPWLSKMFPGGVMERTDPDSKRVYDITGASGSLRMEAAGTAWAHLHGRVTLTDSGGGGFSFSGQLRIVVRYEGDEVADVRGVFEGTYPRTGKDGKFRREFPLTGVFELVRP